MHIDELIETLVTNQITTTNTNKVCLSLTDHWAQGRTVFGGISAGLAYLCCKPLIDDDRVLRSFTVNFVGPLLFDTDFDIVAQTLRTGKKCVTLQYSNYSEWTHLLDGPSVLWCGQKLGYISG